MKQSTFSAVMANKLLRVLQGYTKGIRFVAVLTVLLTMGIGQAWGADVTYTVSKTNAVTTSGTAPTGSSASYTQTYNTACQITSGNSATLTLTKLGGINISNITLSMKSNSSKGAGKLSYSTDGGTNWTTIVSDSKFNTSSWYGSWSTSYVNISKNVSINNVTQLKIKIEASENSLYCASYKLTYTTADTKVTISKGSVSNGSISLNKTSVTTTSAAQSVTVTCTPNTGYYTKSVSATKPATGNTPTYGGSGNSRTVTYSKGSNGSSTITATFSPQWQLRGTFNNWGTTHPLTSFSGNIATVTVDLQAMTAYTFKFVNVSGSTEQWYGNTGAIITDISNWEFSTSINDDARLFTGPAGTYTFKFNVSTKALQVIYPTVTHPAEGYAYFQKQDSWNGFKVYNYTSDNDRLSDWNGSPSVTNTTTICGKTYYYTALATQFQKVIFRDNGSNQWKEISVSGYSGKYCGDDYNATPQTWKTFNKYSITFNSNGGSGSMTALSGICPGESQTLTANSFTRAGHIFNGWNTKEDGTGTNYADKATIANINSNITLYAKWKANTYTITSNLTNCSSSPVIPTSYTYTGSAANLTYKITPESGYRLPDAITVSGCTYTWDKTTGQLKLTGTISGNVTITIEAVKVYTITWKVNKQTYTTGSPTQSIDAGKTYKNLTLPTTPANNTLDECYKGKKFVGWSTTNIGSTESDKPSILFKTAAEAPNTAITENTILYAVFATETPTTSKSSVTTAISGAASGTITDVLSWSSAQNEGTAKTAWNDAGHFRLYPNKNNGNGSSITITPKSGITIDEVVLTATSGTYAKPVKYNIDGGSDVSGTWNDTKMTISGINATSSFKFRNAHIGAENDQVRVTVSVTYLKEISSTKTSNYVTECCTLNNITLDGSGTTTGGTFSATATKACEGEEITLSATAAKCYEFVSWTIKKTSDGSDVTNSVLNGNTLTMPDYAVTVYATFKSLSVTEIALSMTGGHKNLDVGETNQLLVTYTPAYATCDKAIVSWTSSDDNVISVTNSGLVTALRSGNATITATTAAGVSNTYTIVVNNPACEAWYLHYWNASTGGDECFYKVKPDDPNDHEWRTGNFSLPSNSDEDGFVVNNAKGEDPYKTDQIFRTGIGFADIQRGGQNCGTNPYPGQDAYGQLSIYDDSETPNRYIAFYPAQYLVTYGKEGAASWEVLQLNNTTGYEYESEPFMVPNGYKTDDTYKYWVGVTKQDGSILYVEGKSSVDAMNTVSGLSASDMAGKWGVWHIYSNSCANNWYGEFIRYYRVDFDLAGGEGNIAPRYGKAAEPYAKFSTSDITAPTRDGYTFLGWKDQNNKIYAPTEANVTINNDLTLTALWVEEYGSDNCRWEEVTIDDIVYGDEVVIATVKGDMTYALKDNDGGATYAPKAALLTINSNKTINTEETPISNALIWNIDYDKEGTKNLVIYSTKNAGKWLYSINNNNGIRIGTNSDKEFKIVAGTGDDAGNFFLYHIAQKRYLGVYYANLEWRGYTTINTNNITGQTLKFYKRICLPEGQYRVTWDANGGAWSDGSTTKEEIYSVGATINTPDKPELDGYIFDSWEPTPSTMPAENTTFTAKWAELHTITWMVGSSSVLTEEVANGTGVTQTPASNPEGDAIGDCADTFLGWSEKSAGSTPQDAAYYDDLCSAADMKSKHTSITGNKTFYAVFATATTTPGTSTTTNKTYSHTITATTWEANGSQTLNGVSWTLSNNGNYYGHDETKGQQVGSGSKPAKSMTLTTNGFASASKITSVTINTSGASDTNAKVSVKVGGTSYLCNSNTSPSITTTATDYEFTGNSTGDIVISWSQTSSKAIYFKSITVKYSNTTTTPEVTEYSNYVTNCCALAPATNLTVSGTTSNTATLTWTAPSPTTGITKLQVRNAADDAVVVDDIAVGTTTATITGLTECTKYNYYVASVGDCEVFSNIVTAQPFSNAKTVNYDYNGGSGSPASFTTSCEKQEIVLPTATRAGYDFNGWYTAATGGTKIGDAGDTYNPTTSPITLYAQWTKQIYIISFHANGGEGTMANQRADENDVIAQLNANQFTRDGYAFVGWNTKANGTGTAYADQATDITLTGNLTLYAQWAAIVTLNDAGNVTTTHPETAGGSITLEDGANACDPYEFVGWTSVAIADWNEGIEEPALVASPYKPTQPTTLYAVYKIQSEGNANAFKLSFEGGNGKTYYVGSYNNSPYLRGYSNITKEEAVTFIRTKMYPDNDTKYYIYMEHKSEYLYYNGTFNSTSSTPDENQGWVFHTVGDKIKLQSTYSYDPDYLSFSDRDQETINISTSTSGSEFNMLSAVTSTYVASPLCNQEIEIIFETGNGNFVDNAPDTNPLTVSRGDVITLPTCEYPGYEFMGWLKDEQQLDPSDIIGTYYTGDYTVDGVSSTITFYAYYKAIPEEVEFTGKDDVELLMYYYDGTANYYYAVSHAAERGELSSKQNCFNATTWTFTNVGNMQYHIQDETGKYLGAYSDGDNDLILSATPKVWTFTEVNGLWKMVCEDSPSRALMYISTGKKFANAAISNEGNGAYSYVTLGICPYPTYTTNPVLSQGFSITNTAMVTSASGQKVKATSALTLETRNIELPCTFTIAAPNITFYDTNGNEVTQLTASTASEQFELHFAYKPTAENTKEYPTITITDDEMKTYTIKNRIYARSLPATFAIVAKVGNIWYALPSQGLNSTTPPTAYPVEVDDMADPTTVTAVPENADWSLRGVYEASRSDATKDRYVANGDNLVFVNNASPAMVLNASSSEEENYLLTDAQYNNYYSTNPGLYEWTPTTTDLETYQLTNEQRSRTLSVNIATVFGVHVQDKAVEQVRFLPITGSYTPAALQVVEWKENSIVVMYNGAPAQTASVSVNGGAAQTTTLSAAQRDIAVYELAANGLAANPTQRLSITIGAEKVILSIPYIISGETTDLALLPGSTVAARQEVAKVADLVVLKDAKLTADGAKSNPYKFRNVTIYGGGKLVIPSEKGFGVSSLTMRLGTVNDDGSYTNSYPQLVLNGTINTGNINVDYLTTYDRYYALSLPYEVNTTSILYPADIYGDNLKDGGNNASFALQYYDGAARATGATGWKDFDEKVADPILTPYQGYTFWGAPRKVKVNGATEGTRQKYGIHRIPITETASDLMKGEKSLDNNGNVVARTIDIYAHPADRPNDMGWNFLGNPYLAQYGGLSAEDEDVQVGLLEHEMVDGKWTGGWKHTGNLRYVTTTTDGQNYTAVEVDKATFSPFNTFFIQATTDGALSFASASRAQSLPARRYAAQQETAKEITTGILLTGNDQTDRTGLLIADNFTEEYEFNADLSKFENSGLNLYTIGKTGNLAYMAINQALAEQPIPVGYTAPAEGLYTIAFDEDRYNATDISALYLIDYDSNEKTNLLHTDYSFVTAAGTNNQRFALQVAFAPANATNIEWVGDGSVQVGVEGNTLMLNNLPNDAAVHIFDALGRLMYHAPTVPKEMQLTLPTGYYLVRIADKQHAVVIKTVIP